MSCNCKPSESASAETLVAALLFMMTRYVTQHDKTLVQPIMDHFDWLAKHPDLMNSHLQKTCCRLKKSWLMQSERINSLERPGRSLH